MKLLCIINKSFFLLRIGTILLNLFPSQKEKNPYFLPFWRLGLGAGGCPGSEFQAGVSMLKDSHMSGAQSNVIGDYGLKERYRHALALGWFDQENLGSSNM